MTLPTVPANCASMVSLLASALCVLLPLEVAALPDSLTLFLASRTAPSVLMLP